MIKPFLLSFALLTACSATGGAGTDASVDSHLESSVADGARLDADAARLDATGAESSVTDARQDATGADDARADSGVTDTGATDTGATDTRRDVSTADSGNPDNGGVVDPDAYTWRRIETPGPSPRSSTGTMVYDSARQRVVLFGGRGPDGYFGDTWEWDGSAWMLRETNISPPTGSRRMVFDRTRNVAVLFGGVTNVNGQETLMNDTWEWDGNTWTAKTPLTTPQARANHSLAFDSMRNRVVLFGGYAGTAYSSEGDYLRDTWEWDGQNWTAMNPGVGPAAPTARSAHSSLYDPTSQQTLLFGGDTSWQNSFMIAVDVRNDTWSWNGTAWAQLNDAGSPPVRRMASMAFDTTRNFAILFGGEDIRSFDSAAPSHFLNDMWRFQNGRWTQIAIANGPSQRSRFALAYDEARNQLVLFGGMTSSLGSRIGDTWVYGRN